MLRELAKTIRELWDDPRGRLASVSVATLLAVGSIFYRLVEGWSWVDSLYFTVITLTTVGYGDLAPSGPGSKLFTIVLILAGVGSILAFLDLVVRRTAQRKTEESSAE